MADKTNKLNFYLIKAGLQPESIFKQGVDELEVIDLGESGQIYYSPKYTLPAPWPKNFFQRDFTRTTQDGSEVSIFNSASTQAVFLRRVPIRGNSVTFAVCFGTGYHLLSKDSFEPKFGLLSVLSIVNETSLRRIDKHDISGTPKFAAEQLAKKGGLLDFGLDVDLDILLGATGTLDKKDPRESRLKGIFGTTLSGKSNLNVNARFDVDDIDKLLKASYAAFNSQRYSKKGFDWIDKITPVKKGTAAFKAIIDQLDDDLANDRRDKIWLSVPELVEWQDISGFVLNNQSDRLFEDITFDALQEVFTEAVTTSSLQSISVVARHADGTREAYRWTAYQCLYAEVVVNSETYILINSEWYQIKADVVTEANNKYQQILQDHGSDIQFEDYVDDDNNENGYNARMASNIANSVCMDAKNIHHGGGHSKIEFCDIFCPDKRQIIHVKKYSGSSVLSHLFAQGYVSSQLLLDDPSFKRKVEDKIQQVSGAAYSFSHDDDYEVVFGIIAKPGKNDLPLFSKINLSNTFSRIRNLRGFSASIAFISNNASLEKAEEEGEA